jgi:SAM-dependent methyltransferase
MERITETVRERYAEAARRLTSGEHASCGCSSTPVGAGNASAVCCDPITSNLYDEQQAGEVPDTALRASLGCGNPTALAQLNPGDTVLDLGSGGGIDVILSARRVGPDGKAYGLDMTGEMLALAEDNRRKAGVTNVEFLQGHIESIPLPEAAVDVIISNCVINLSADKDRVIREAFRVLRPGGRFAVSDVVVRGEIPEAVRRSMELWVGCVAGALTENEYRGSLTAAGFEDVEIETTRVYDVNDARAVLTASGLDADAVASSISGRVTSAFVRARKPLAGASTTAGEVQQACCGPTCCN